MSSIDLAPKDRETQLFKSACRIHTDHFVHRYLMSCAAGRWCGSEKAHFHRELCSFYVSVVHGCADPDNAMRDHEVEYKAVHEATQKLTDNLDEEIGFPLTGVPDYDRLAPKFFERFHEIAMATLIPQLESEHKQVLVASRRHC